MGEAEDLSLEAMVDFISAKTSPASRLVCRLSRSERASASCRAIRVSQVTNVERPSNCLRYWYARTYASCMTVFRFAHWVGVVEIVVGIAVLTRFTGCALSERGDRSWQSDPRVELRDRTPLGRLRGKRELEERERAYRSCSFFVTKC